jgi:ABC-type transport system involved in multi-copper enzyme maturation permease subunit
MSRESLEGIVEDHGKHRHVKHYDALDAVNKHVVFLIFLALMFLVGLIMFMFAEPNPDATAYAIVEFEPVTIHTEMADAVSGALHSIRLSEDRPLLMLALYTFWIIVFGLINMVIYERQIEKRHKK